MTKRWTKEEIELVVLLDVQNVLHTEIARRIGRSRQAVTHYLRNMRLGYSNGGVQKRGMTRKGEKHGLTKHPLYPTFTSIYNRCTNQNNSKFADYGGRGIRLEDYWNPDVVGRGLALRRFVEYVEAELEWFPGCGKTIDRKDNEHGNYARGELRLATPKEQANNRRPRLRAFRSRVQQFAPFTWVA